ncbi:hypothetical protein [Nocardia wallacei]|uniref:hypothetical protein n=1 Tax=Nocardia wallacei TaxID=480035 RepID=UPI0024540AF0|nr:hypothetical protein [Nocardia wallacei]
MTSYGDYRGRVIEAQAQWSAERERIYQSQREIAGSYAGPLQPPHITSPDNYDHLTLEQMTNTVSAMRPDLVDDAYRTWDDMSRKLALTFSTFTAEFERTVDAPHGRGWSGAAASAAVAAIERYRDRSMPLAQAAAAIGLKLQEMRAGLEETRLLMPGITEPVDVTGKTLPKGGVMKMGDHTATEAEQEARRILRTVYAQVAAHTDAGMPYMPDAPEIVDGPSAPDGSVVPSGLLLGNSDVMQSLSAGSSHSIAPAVADRGSDGLHCEGTDQAGTQPVSTDPAIPAHNPAHIATTEPPATPPAEAGSTATRPAETGSPPSIPAAISGTNGGTGSFEHSGGVGGSGGPSGSGLPYGSGGPGGSARSGGVGWPGGVSGSGGSAGAGGVGWQGDSSRGGGSCWSGGGGESSSAGGVGGGGGFTGAGNGVGAGGSGRSVRGGVSAVAPVVAGADSDGVGAHRPGVAGAPGIGAFAGKPVAEEKERAGAPEYLVTREHGDEVTGLRSSEVQALEVVGEDDRPRD